MANPITFQKSMGKYLWYSLLHLGFDPETETSSLAGKTTVKYINLGVHMFDKPNKDAFYIVTHFLLHKLDPARFSELYRHCWPVYNRKADADFRKITLSWLKDIVDENSKSAPKVLASLFLSPGGASFTALILHLAKHVMLQEMKTFTTDNDWYPEGAARPASSLNIAMKRLQLTKARLLKSAVRQDNLLQEYQRRAQALVKSIKEIRSEGAKYDQLLKSQGDEQPEEEDASAHKLNKVRSLWSSVDTMLSALKEERLSVASVLMGGAGQHSLDGADLSLKIPAMLLERIQRSPQQLSSGNVYEAGQLNPLCALELMNHALQLLAEERSRVGGQAPLGQLRPQELQTRSGQAARALEEIKVLRQRISKEEIPAVRAASLRLDQDWDRRWQETLSATPLPSFLSDDPMLCFLSPMAPLSFEPASEAACSASVFSRYAAKFGAEAPDDEESAEAESQAELDTGLPELNRSTGGSAPLVRAETPAAVAASIIANSSLADLLGTLSPSPSPPPTPPPSPPPVQQARDETGLSGCKAAPMKKKANILDQEFDNLASQYAEVITKMSPGDCKWRDLDNVLCSLGGDPFSTRKQLHRTPESLIADVKSSWRKALEESKLNATGPTPQPYAARMPPSALSFSATPDAPKPVAAPPRSPSTPLVSSPGTGASRGGPAAAASVAIPFSLDDETLPDMASSDSPPSLSDEDPDHLDSPDADHLLLSPFAAPPRNLLDLDNDDFEASFRGTGPPYPGSAACWLLEPDAAAPPGSDTLFSLDLEGLTPPRQEYNLPKLVTFSPMDDL